MSRTTILNFNLLRQPQQPVRGNEANLVPPMMYMDAVEWAQTMAIAMAEKDRENYKRPGDIIEHTKKYKAYDFYSILDLGQADK